MRYPSSPFKPSHFLEYCIYFNPSKIRFFNFCVFQNSQKRNPLETKLNNRVAYYGELPEEELSQKFYSPGYKWCLYRGNETGDWCLKYTTPYWETFKKDILLGKTYKKVYKSLGFKEPEDLDIIEDGYDLSCPSQEYLANILRQCPKVEVSSPPKPPLEHFVFNNRLSFSLQIGHSELATRNWLRYQPIQGKWYTPATLEQYRALCLMQSYTPYFDSCQEVFLDEISVEETRKYLEEGFEELTEAKDLFKLRQDRDFESGLCRRYFQLDCHGFVEKRFSIYTLTDGTQVVSNFYNCSKQEISIDGTTYKIPQSINEKFQGYSYFNKVTG